MVGTRASLVIWHYRLGHLFPSVLCLVLPLFAMPTLTSVLMFCDICATNKAHRLLFSLWFHTAGRPIEIVHLDLWGSALIMSCSGHRHYLSIVNDFTWFFWIFPLFLLGPGVPEHSLHHQQASHISDWKPLAVRTPLQPYARLLHPLRVWVLTPKMQCAKSRPDTPSTLLYWLFAST